MRSIKRISAAAQIYARRHNVTQKTKNLMSAVTISTMGTVALYNSSKMLPNLIRDEFLYNRKHIAIPAIKNIVSNKTTTFPLGFDWKNMKTANPFEYKLLTEAKAADAIKTTMEIVFEQEVNAVKRVMEEDKSFTSHNLKDTIAAQIVKIARKYEMNPIYIACIAKRETHLTPNLNGKATKGMMQITMGALNPMYKYPQNFNPKMEDIKKIYPTAGELFEELGKNPELNLEVGTIFFQTCLKLSKGNLLKALELYNNSYLKEEYAADVLKNIKKYS